MKNIFLIAALGTVATLALLLCAPWASSAPDGLEKILDQAGAQHQNTVAPLADYALPGVENEGPSTVLAGFAGALAVFAISMLIARILTRRKNDTNSTPQLP
jgi:hypothetical protein